MNIRPESYGVKAEITVTNKEAELLEFVCSFDLLDWFAEKVTRQYTKEQLREGLQAIREQARKITEVHTEILALLKKGNEE